MAGEDARSSEEGGETLEGDEGMAIRRFEVLDAEFHRGIVDLVCNRRTAEIYSSLNVLGWTLRVNYVSANQRALEGQEEHRAILRAFEARDVEQARRAIANHVINAKEDLVQRIGN